MNTAIDLFAGAGGFTEGATAAGLRVLWAANHNPLAVQYHRANHPEAMHVCQDLHQANWHAVPRHDVTCASPSCTGHTDARGKEEDRHDAARSTAWAVISCLEVHRTPFAVVENVPEFLDWTLYPAWKLAAESLGYSVSPHVLDAADFGVPQNRVRVFIVLSRSRFPLVLKFEPLPHVPISSVLRWNDYRWNPLHRPGRSKATIARAERGRLEVGERYAMPFYGSGSGETGRSLARPIGTVTTKDRWALMDWTSGTPMIRMMQPREYAAAMGLRPDFILPKTRAEAIHLIGNMVAVPVARDVLLALKAAA